MPCAPAPSAACRSMGVSPTWYRAVMLPADVEGVWFNGAPGAEAALHRVHEEGGKPHQMLLGAPSWWSLRLQLSVESYCKVSQPSCCTPEVVSCARLAAMRTSSALSRQLSLQRRLTHRGQSAASAESYRTPSRQVRPPDVPVHAQLVARLLLLHVCDHHPMEHHCMTAFRS
jgi:hypothetical protein